MSDESKPQSGVVTLDYYEQMLHRDRKYPCRDCSDRFGTADALARHRGEVHPPPAPFGQRTKQREYCPRVYHSRGRAWEGKKKTYRKKSYPTIDKAWRYAFLSFARSGLILTPYRCSTKRVNGKPLSLYCCDWHLTGSASQMLPAGRV